MPDKNKESNAEKVLREPELNRAVLRRLEEFQKLRRDLTGRLAENGAVMEQQMAQAKALLQELEAGREMVSRHQSEIAQINSDEWKKEHLQSELGNAMRKLENCRLDLISKMARIAEMAGTAPAREKTQTSLKPELNSLTFRQMLRFGFAFMLPLCLTMLAVAAIIAAAVFLSMRV